MISSKDTDDRYRMQRKKTHHYAITLAKFMSLVIHYWIGDVQDYQGLIRLRNDLYCVGWGVKLYLLTHPMHLRCATVKCSAAFTFSPPKTLQCGRSPYMATYYVVQSTLNFA